MIALRNERFRMDNGPERTFLKQALYQRSDNTFVSVISCTSLTSVPHHTAAVFLSRGSYERARVLLSWHSRDSLKLHSEKHTTRWIRKLCFVKQFIKQFWRQYRR